jgi:hypothetical protein
MPLNLPDAERADYLEARAPGPHLDLLHAAGFRAAGAALRPGVFDALADGPPLPCGRGGGESGRRAVTGRTVVGCI